MRAYTKRYTSEFKEQALLKVYNRRNGQSIQNIADELNINFYTLIRWMDKAAMESSEIPPKRLKDWQLEDKLDALHKTYGLVGEELNAWCREQGVFVHQLAQWKADFCRQSSELTKREEAREVQGLKTEIQSLERELLRKDRALAEAAALLVLQKKFRALLGGEEK